jgi:glycosyltransferase involved in cell wall biosynthesis
LATNAQAHAQVLFGPPQAAASWAPLLAPAHPVQPASAVRPQPAVRLRRRRLLVPHVFFAPQSIGGATRVVQDQVRALALHCADRYEVTVLCTNHAPWQLSGAGETAGVAHDEEASPAVSVHDWQGARVVRLALPPRAWRHHRHRGVEAFCRWWLPQERFDLIHAHCLQVLSVEPLLMAAELSIPYAVTLHDGWWLSPRQFLITASGAPVDPADPLSHLDDPGQIDPSLLQADHRRRIDLQQVLAGAASRLAVSEPFAGLYRRAGIEGVSVMENRWQPMPAQAPRTPRAAHLPLRACCVGGMAMHKGLAVLEAALRQAQLPAPGLQLTLVDGGLPDGESYRLTWGTTPVEVVASVPMEAMAGFYAQHDVLIAPSIWPESYGLVTREALSAGLWVVASEIGALAEPIRHGENGHRVPPGNAVALVALLEQLCLHHPTPQPLLAFTGAQLPLELELEQLYSHVVQSR